MRFKLVIACAFACCLSPLLAQQRAMYMPGQYGLNAGIMPSPGFTYADLNLNYDSSRFNDRNGNAVPTVGSYNVWVIENVFEYVPNFKVAGGNLGFVIVFPTAANGSLAESEFGVSGQGIGLADTWLQPFTIGWHLRRADIEVADALWIPTGRYRLGASNNVGYGNFGNHLTAAATAYLTKNKATSASIFSDWEVHSTKNGTNFIQGQAFSDEWGVGQILPLKKNFSQLLQLGGVGYDQWQITQNQPVLTNTPFYSVHAAGLQANYILPAKDFSIFFKYYWEYKAYAHTLGRTASFGFAWTLRDPKPKPAKP